MLRTIGSFLSGLTVLFVLSASAAASTACTINTIPDWDDNYTYGFVATAQVITPTARCPELVEYAFELAPRSTPGNVTFSIYQWGPTGPVGSPLFTTTLPWGTTKTVILVSNINLTLTPGTPYGIDIDLQGYTTESVAFQNNQIGYKHGDGWWYNGTSWADVPGTNHKFRAKWAPSGK